MKKILGLDLGTNSIGWAVINAEEQTRDDNTTFLSPTGISSAGCRIIPMDEATMSNFNSGKTSKNSTVKSQTAKRTDYRGMRRLIERNLLRRERLLRILNILGFLPEHFATKINRYGKFVDDSEPKIAWTKNADGKQEFLFKDSFNEMLKDFAKNQPQLVENQKKVPYDWTIYYLRKKALTQPITKEELAWILLQFNQKRGYYQLRNEEEEQNDKLVEYHALKVIKVEATEDKKGDDIWYNVHLENGWIYRRTSKYPLDWVGKIKEFVVTTDLEKDGTPKKDKDGNIKRSFRAPKEDDWTLHKKKTEHDIEQSKETIGCYIYDNLLAKPDQKIIGKLVRTVERKFYKDELRQILDFQKNDIPELQNEQLFNDCIEELYPNNEPHRNNIAKISFTNFFINDILFYQRPLKTKKSLISDCPYESHKGKDGKEYPVKCIAKSNPLFQEFRLWQFIQNLRIYPLNEINHKSQQLEIWASPRIEDKEKASELFDFLSDKEKITQNTILKFFNVNGDEYCWQYPPDKVYQGNVTKAKILKRLKNAGISADFLTKEKEYALWHILYSVDDNIEIRKALKKFAEKNGLDVEPFVENFRKCTFEKEYGSYSEKAIKKLLPLMRCGKYWNADAIDANTKDRIEKIVNGEYDESIKDRVREKAFHLTDINNFQGLPVWLACYIVYNRHSEAKEISKWETPQDIDDYLKNFKQHSLHNPIVEQVVTETLRTVRDIWKQEGQIDEIHLELGREMKNPAEKREKMSKQIQENENTNLRIKALLMEFMNPEMGIENVRPYSLSQQDILRIYEEYALNTNEHFDNDKQDFVPDTEDTPDYVTKVISGLGSSDSKKQPSKNDIIRYKCWLEQRYRSPYTGKLIPLSKLFTDDYEIEHVIPRAIYFDDSFSNKVICEADVNELKGKQLGYEFIKNHHGEKVQLSQGEIVTILSEEYYIKFVKEHYSNNRTKMKKLLMDDIPDGFIERQLNDSRYISKLVKGLLSNIVREKDSNGELEQEAVSKNLISCNGAITDRLKKDWGMNDVWNRIVLPRFRRLNKLTGKDCFTTTSNEGHEIPAMPIELQKGFNKKRIDHRHHAMDAIVIACTTRSHVQYLNNESAKTDNRKVQIGLAKQLCSFKDVEFRKKIKNANGVWVESEEVVRKNVPDTLLKPWDTFTTDAYNTLQNIIVSFKQNLRVINKAENYYQHYENGKKEFAKQIKGDNWAIRKSMHKETIWGEVNLKRIKTVSLQVALKNPKSIVNKDLRNKVLELQSVGQNEKAITQYIENNKDVWSEIDVKNIKIYYFTQDDKGRNGKVKTRYFATRFLSDLVTYLGKSKSLEDALKKIDATTDDAIKLILKAHLKAKNGNYELAFSPDGIDEMNRNIVALNNGKPHKPIYKVRRFESGNKFAVGHKGNKKSKFAEADDGTNLFFAVFETITDKEAKRSFLTIPLNVMIDCQKKFAKDWRNNIEKYFKEQELISEDCQLIFILSPNDLVYLPSNNSTGIDKSRIYKIVSFTGNRLYAISNSVSKSIVDKMEYTQLNKLEFTDDKVSFKEICVPLSVDRLGNIIKVGF